MESQAVFQAERFSIELCPWIHEDGLEAPAVDGGDAVQPLEEVGELALDPLVAAGLDRLRHGLHRLPRELQ